MVFTVVMYGCKSETVKKAEHQKIDVFKLWCWRRLLIVPWIARRSNQSILREINSEYSLEGLMLKLKLQYFGHLMWTADSKSLILGKIDGRRRRGCQRMRWLDGITDAMDMNSQRGDGEEQRGLIHAAVHGVTKNQTRLGNWTTTVVNNLPANEGDIRDAGLIPGLGRSPGEGNGYPLQSSCLEKPMDRGDWQTTVHRDVKNQTWLKQLSTRYSPKWK